MRRKLQVNKNEILVKKQDILTSQTRDYPYPPNFQMPKNKPCEWRYAANSGQWGGIQQGDMCYGDGKWNILWDQNGSNFEYDLDQFDWNVRCPRMGFASIGEKWIDTLYGGHGYGFDQETEWIEGCDLPNSHAHDREYNAMTAHGIFIPYPEDGYPIGSMKPHRFFIRSDDGIKFIFSGDTFADLHYGANLSPNVEEYGQQGMIDSSGPGGQTPNVYDFVVGDTSSQNNTALPNTYSLQSSDYCFYGQEDFGGSNCLFQEWYDEYSNRTYSEAPEFAPAGDHIPGDHMNLATNSFNFSTSCSESAFATWNGDGGGNMNSDFWPTENGCCVINVDLRVGKMYPIRVMYSQGEGNAHLKIKYLTGYVHDALGPHNCGGDDTPILDENTWNIGGNTYLLEDSNLKGIDNPNAQYFESANWIYGCCDENDSQYDSECSGYVAGGDETAVVNDEVIMTTGNEAAFIGVDGFLKSDGSWCYCFDFACESGGHAPGSGGSSGNYTQGGRMPKSRKKLLREGGPLQKQKPDVRTIFDYNTCVLECDVWTQNAALFIQQNCSDQYLFTYRWEMYGGRKSLGECSYSNCQVTPVVGGGVATVNFPTLHNLTEDQCWEYEGYAFSYSDYGNGNYQCANLSGGFNFNIGGGGAYSLDCSCDISFQPYTNIDEMQHHSSAFNHCNHIYGLSWVDMTTITPHPDIAGSWVEIPDGGHSNTLGFWLRNYHDSGLPGLGHWPGWGMGETCGVNWQFIDWDEIYLSARNCKLGNGDWNEGTHEVIPSGQYGTAQPVCPKGYTLNKGGICEENKSFNQMPGISVAEIEGKLNPIVTVGESPIVSADGHIVSQSRKGRKNNAISNGSNQIMSGPGQNIDDCHILHDGQYYVCTDSESNWQGYHFRTKAECMNAGEWSQVLNGCPDSGWNYLCGWETGEHWDCLDCNNPAYSGQGPWPNSPYFECGSRIIGDSPGEYRQGGRVNGRRK